jgi:hypothetical protein
MKKNKKTIPGLRPKSPEYPENPGIPVTVKLPNESLAGIEEIDLVDGPITLSHHVGKAIHEYIMARKSAPTFPEELADARFRQQVAVLQQQHPQHIEAPKEII